MPILNTIATADGAEWLVAWLDIAVRGVLWLGAAALLARALRRASAATRHLVWSVAVLALVALPVLLWTLPSWRAPLPERARGVLSHIASMAGPSATPHSEPQQVVSGSVSSQSSRGTASLAIEQGDEPTASNALQTAPVRSVERENVRLNSQDTAPATLGTSVASPRNRLAWILPIWAVGALLVAGCFALQHGSVRYLASRAQKETNASILWRIERARQQVGLGRRSVQVLRGGMFDMPMTWGFTRAVLLLPQGMPQWPEARQRDVLLHELAHIKRYDHLTQLVAQLACALHWFNPLAWYAARRMILEREHACDDFVLNTGARPSDYAQHLLDVARAMRAHRVGAAAAIAMAGQSTLPRRLRAVLEPRRSRRSLGLSATAAVLLLAALFVVPLAAVDVRQAPRRIEVSKAARRNAVAPVAPAVTTKPPRFVRAPLGVLRVAPTAPIAQAAPVAQAAPTAPTAPVAPVAQGASGMMLAGGSVTEVSVHKGRWNFSWRDGDDRLRIRARGEIELNDDMTDIVSVSHRGFIDMEEERGRDKRRIKLQGERDGSVKRQWWVDGKEQPYDDAARAWLAETLPDFTRRAGFAVDQRVATLLSRGGVDSVLEEIEQVDSDHVVRLYFSELTSQADLDAEQLERVLEHAGAAISSDFELASLLIGALEEATLRPEGTVIYARATQSIGSDFEQSRVLRALVQRYELDEVALREVIDAAHAIGSDFELARLLLEIARDQELTAALHRPYFEATRTIGSDFEHRRVLNEFMERDDLDDALVEELLLSAARSISSDYEQAELLVALAKRRDVQPAWMRAYVEALETIGSDYEFRRAAEKLVQESKLDDTSLVLLLEAAEHSIGSDFEMAQLLVQVARTHDLSEETREAYLRASDTIGSNHENRRVLSELVKAER